MRTRTDRARRELEQRLGLPPRTIEDRVFSSDLSTRAQSGEISEPEFWSSLGRDLNLAQFDLSPQTFRLEFFADDFLDGELIQFFRNARGTFKTGLISNAWDGLRELLTDLWHIDDAFDVITISAEEKVMKPDARIFHTALERLGVQAAEAIFLDDFKVNVDAANALGLIGVHFRSSEQAQRDIRALLDGKG
ncbi:MAG: HAD-IA family hydrolase [Anaerolineae bacterium]